LYHFRPERRQTGNFSALYPVPPGKPGDFVDNTIRESARRSAGRLMVASPMLAERVKDGKLKIVPAVYNLEDGSVEYLV
jgi:hypothetical protein